MGEDFHIVAHLRVVDAFLPDRVHQDRMRNSHQSIDEDQDETENSHLILRENLPGVDDSPPVQSQPDSIACRSRFLIRIGRFKFRGGN